MNPAMTSRLSLLISALQDGQRVKTVRYVYDGNLVAQELESSDGATFVAARRYARGLDLSQTLQGAGGIGGLLAYTDPSGSHTYSTDGNGNIVDLTDANGASAAHYEYAPFGQRLVATGALADANPHHWSSKEFDPESGLVYYLYRFYHPDLGRWINRDPIEEKGGDNLYAFVLNKASIGINSFGYKLIDLGKRSDDDIHSIGGKGGVMYLSPIDIVPPDFEGDNCGKRWEKDGVIYETSNYYDAK